MRRACPPPDYDDDVKSCGQKNGCVRTRKTQGIVHIKRSDRQRRPNGAGIAALAVDERMTCRQMSSRRAFAGNRADHGYLLLSPEKPSAHQHVGVAGLGAAHGRGAWQRRLLSPRPQPPACLNRVNIPSHQTY